MEKKQVFFQTDDMHFVATLLLLGGFELRAVTPTYPKYYGQKIYQITPFEEAKRMLNSYELDEIKLSPRLIKQTLKKIRLMSPEPENRIPFVGRSRDERF